MKRELNFDHKHPILYLIATPIGNMKELSPRAIEIIKAMDYIVAEDTRVSGKLLAHHQIKKPFISCHEHNETVAAKEVVRLLKDGKQVAYMSDAGMPCISDPGYILVKECILNDINISPVSGPNAALDALIASGLDTAHFYFHGFLSAKTSVRKEELRHLYLKSETLIFYEAPHRILKTLKDMLEILGKRKAVIAREVTKLHEEFIRGNLEELVKLEQATLKGEMVIIVEGHNNEQEKFMEPKDIISLVQNLENMGMSTKDAIKKASDLLNLPKRDVYNLYHRAN
ncbi:MAG: 16S rRNA (cytidine(1402)-2'-O)-methyltransferase [Bacilli bacterium]|nr:16S rRNA (cytidine(1402)-2'-O)-methyltransferase [Bacilli bacterium]